MIIALLEDKRIIATRELERVDYICPHCKEIVRIKKGLIKIPHFAHKSLSDCGGEPETELHVKMKLQIAEILGLSLENLEISHKYKDSRVISDVYDPKTNIAYEIQCNSLSLAEMEKRWKKYEELGMNQVWIFKQNDFEKCYSQFCLDKVSLHNESRGLYFNNEGKLFWMYYIKSYKFCTIYDIIEFKSFTDIFKCVKIRMEEYRNERMASYKRSH